jgi:hypothetical protein
MSPLMILALVFALAAIGTIVFVAVVIGIHSEPSRQMATHARGPLSTIVRRLLGVYVARPTRADTTDDREECLTGSSTDWWDRDGWRR